jgi:hypothetical protein
VQLHRIQNPHNDHTRRRCVAQPGSRNVSIRGDKHNRSVSRAQPVHHHNRFQSRATIGFKSLRKQKPATVQSRVLDRRNYRSANARQKHS